MELKSMVVFLMTSTILMFISSQFGIISSEPAGENSLRKLQLPQAYGGEDIEFDPKSEVFYTGLADGRILKFVNGTFIDFATTSPHRTKEECEGKSGPMYHRPCGRPLGLTFDQRTGELYISDAFYGLLKVGPNGGLATQVVAGVNGQNFDFLNAMEIEESTGNLYFIDSGAIFLLVGNPSIFKSGDTTGRLLKYEATTGEVTVVLNGLSGPAGMAMSSDQTFLIISEYISGKVFKYYIKGPKAHTTKTLQLENLKGHPVNVKRAKPEGFWMPMNIFSDEQSTIITQESFAVKFDGNGKVLAKRKISLHLPNFTSVYLEHGGRAYTGSTFSGFMGVGMALQK